MKKFLLIVIVIIISSSPLQAKDQIVNLIQKCTGGKHEQPNGPFAVIVFCEGALGNYIALYYKEIMRNPLSPKYPKWMLGNRVWEDSEWGSDVTGFVWGSAGDNLYVATSNIYGEGGLFDVDLKSRKASKMYPLSGKDNLGYTIEIVDLDRESKTIEILKKTYNDTERSWREERTIITIQ